MAVHFVSAHMTELELMLEPSTSAPTMGVGLGVGAAAVEFVGVYSVWQAKPQNHKSQQTAPTEGYIVAPFLAVVLQFCLPV